MQTSLPDRDPQATAAHMSGRFRSSRFPDAILGRIGTLEVRLARDASEMVAAQEVRYRVFYEELGAQLPGTGTAGRDADRFDDVCDHLLVLDSALPGPDVRRIVGTYRLLRQQVATEAGGFYSGKEFEIEQLIARHPNAHFLELGRSCVLPGYRSKRTIEALWQGIWSYVSHHGVEVMTGCASFQGIVPADHAVALSYLAHHCSVSPEWSVRAVAERYLPMDILPADSINLKAAMAAMPPLIKGYLRVGAKIGYGCVIDHQFRTTDVFVVMPVKEIAVRYVNYYGADAERFAA